MRSREAPRTVAIFVAALMVAVEAVAPASVTARVASAAVPTRAAHRPLDVSRLPSEPTRAARAARTTPVRIPATVVANGAAAVESFVQTQELAPVNGLGNYYGSSVAIEGDTMVVVAARDYRDPFDDCGYGVGYVYTRQPGSPFWDLTAHLIGSDRFGTRANEDCYGYWNFRTSVAIRGTTIAIGVAQPLYTQDPAAPDGEAAQGKVYMYRQHLGRWVDATEDRILTSKVGPPNGTWLDHFGDAVALQDENTVVVGAPYAYGGSGAVYVYESDGLTSWTQTAQLRPETPDNGLAFGATVGVSGRTIVVGNWHDPDYGFPPRGVLAVFDEPADGWADATPTVELPVASDSTGDSAAIDGDTIVAGTFSKVPWNNSIRLQPTGAEVFERTLGAWDVTARLVASDLGDMSSLNAENFGSVVAIQGDTVAVSNIDDGNGAGAVYVFQKPGASWGDASAPGVVEETQKLIGANPGTSLPNDTAGYSLALDGSTLAVGALWRTEVVTSGCDLCDGSYKSGGVFVFGQTTDTTPPTTTITRDPPTPNASGWDNVAPTIAVSAADDPAGSGVFQVRCQVDGNIVTAFDQMAPGCDYAPGKPFTTQSIHTLYAAAVDAAGNRSAVVSLTLKVDTIAPSSTVDLSPAVPDGADGSYTTPVTVTLNPHRDGIGSEIAEARCAVNPATPPVTAADLPICPTYFFSPGLEYQASGDYTVWVALRDEAGNQEAPHSRSFSIHAAPTTTIAVTPSTPSGSAGWYKAAVTVAVTATAVGTANVVGYRCVLDPATPPAAYADMADACPYGAGGAKITTDGHHVVYAASRDDHGNASAVVSRSINIDGTPPTLTCDGSGPASFTLGDVDTEVTATVADATSGPAAPTASSPITSTDLGTVGNRTKAVSATDVAGNQATVNCAYVVGYDVDVLAPADGATFKAGTTVMITFRLRNASGVDITDTDAAVLLGGKKKPCLITGLYDGTAQTACATYAAATDVFSLSIKTPKGRTVVGAHHIGLQIKAPNGSGIVNVVLIPILLN